jgi:hypothetical protein
MSEEEQVVSSEASATVADQTVGARGLEQVVVDGGEGASQDIDLNSVESLSKLTIDLLRERRKNLKNEIEQLENSKRNIKPLFNSFGVVFGLVAALNLAAAISIPVVDSSFLDIFGNNTANIAFYSSLIILSIALAIISHLWKNYLVERKKDEIKDKRTIRDRCKSTIDNKTASKELEAEDIFLGTV